MIGENLPDVDEPISSFSNCPGNIYTAVMRLHDGKQLKDMSREECQEALIKVFDECDKNEDGIFNSEYAVNADLQWSNGHETKRMYTEWARVFRSFEDRHGDNFKLNIPFQDYASFCGHDLRSRLRVDGMRFFLYYKSGYNVHFEW